MRSLQVLLSIVIVLLLVPPAQAQRRESNNERYRVTTTDGHRFSLFHAWVDGSTVTGNLIDGTERTISRDSVMALEIKQGTHARTGLAVGALFGLSTFLAAVADAESDPNTEIDDSKVVPALVILTGGGAALGGIVGAMFPKWQLVEFGSFGSTDDHGGAALSLNLGSSPSTGGPGLSLSLHF